MDLCLVDGNNSDSVHLLGCTGPATCSQTKLQRTLKVNVLLNECFDSSVKPTIVGPCSYTLKTLIADYFWLQREFLGQVFHS